jgi:hypothetical protein
LLTRPRHPHALATGTFAELRYGELNHRPYNLGWGHHHCNVVVKDAGIDETIGWMRSVVERNDLAYRIAKGSNEA